MIFIKAGIFTFTGSRVAQSKRAEQGTHHISADYLSEKQISKVYGNTVPRVDNTSKMFSKKTLSQALIK